MEWFTGSSTEGLPHIHDSFPLKPKAVHRRPKPPRPPPSPEHNQPATRTASTQDIGTELLESEFFRLPPVDSGQLTSRSLDGGERGKDPTSFTSYMHRYKACARLKGITTSRVYCSTRMRSTPSQDNLDLSPSRLPRRDTLPTSTVPTSNSHTDRKTDPTKTDPAKTDPTKTDPTNTDPNKTNPNKTDTIKTDPTKADPNKTDANKTDATKTDPNKTDPAKTDPNKTDPAKTDPNKIDPAKTDPNKIDPAKTDTNKTDPNKTDPNKPDTNKTDTNKTDVNKTDPAKTDPNKIDPTKTDPNKMNPNKTDPAKTDTNKTDPNKTDPNKTDPTKTDPNKTDAGKADPVSGGMEADGVHAELPHLTPPRATDVKGPPDCSVLEKQIEEKLEKDKAQDDGMTHVKQQHSVRATQGRRRRKGAGGRGVSRVQDGGRPLGDIVSPHRLQELLREEDARTLPHIYYRTSLDGQDSPLR